MAYKYIHHTAFSPFRHRVRWGMISAHVTFMAIGARNVFSRREALFVRRPSGVITAHVTFMAIGARNVFSRRGRST